MAKNNRGRPTGATKETRKRVISSLRSAYPGVMSRYSIRDKTGVHPRILESLLIELIRRNGLQDGDARGAYMVCAINLTLETVVDIHISEEARAELRQVEPSDDY